MADTKEKEVKLKSRTLTQADINAIEKRLALSGGTTIGEMASDLANRNGTAAKARDKLQEEKAFLQSPLDTENGKISPESRDRLQKLNVEIKQGISALKKKEIAEYIKPVENYIISEYGEAVMGTTGLPERHGDRVFIDEYKHYRKRW